LGELSSLSSKPTLKPKLSEQLFISHFSCCRFPLENEASEKQGDQKNKQ
jgi:hypothetical protein